MDKVSVIACLDTIKNRVLRLQNKVAGFLCSMRVALNLTNDTKSDATRSPTTIELDLFVRWVAPAVAK